MTKLTHEAIEWRAMLAREQVDWPWDLVEAATLVRCELDAMRLKSWEASGGREALRRYTARFERLYTEWKWAQS